MPDTRSHRGPASKDPSLFGPKARPALREAVADLSWLLGRGYAEPSALKLVGDRYRLVDRQRQAVLRSSCPEAARLDRRRRRAEPEALRGRPVHLDGFNVLTTVEAALGGAVVILGRDGSLRDIAGVHGSYRKVEETAPAVALIGQRLETIGAGPCRWWLDQPVSNSGRLRALLLEVAEQHGWPWQVVLAYNPDAELIATEAPAVVASADSDVLDRCGLWTPLARIVVEALVPDAFWVDLERPAEADDRGSNPVGSVAGPGSGQ